MKKHPVATIINFCSNEARFIKACLEQAQLFSEQVIVVVCDHFFDGTSENRPLLDQIYHSFPNCQFIEYPFAPKKIPKRVWSSIDQAHFWHSLSRLVGYHFLKNDIQYVLFLDADEVPDGKRFSEWLDSFDYTGYTTLKLANYWYFREPCNRALSFEDSIVFSQKNGLKSDMLLHQEERDAIYEQLPSPKKRQVADLNGIPMFHHFSWVRTQEEMMKKVMAWGHKGDRDWDALVKEHFETPFQGKDFVHGYSYETVTPLFDIRLEAVDFFPNGGAQIEKISEDKLLKFIKFKKFWNFLDF